MLNMEIPAFIYTYKGKQYNVFISKRFQRNIYYRFRKDGFYVSCPRLTSRLTITQGLDKFAGKLIAQFEKRNGNYSFSENYIYILGERYELSHFHLENDKDIHDFLNEKAKVVFFNLVRKNEEIMGIKNPYKIKIKNTGSQFGSNSKQTHTLSFQFNLIHFSEEIIESVVIHELAHDFYRNHQEGFYEVVYKYCPKYKEIQKKLKKGIHK